MEPTPLSAATAAPQTTIEADAASALSSDFDTFLTLLTAQIENQDPLNPQDATEYASQLATFSNVEQNVRTNTLMEDLIARIDNQGLQGLAQWVGMEARTEGATAYEGGAITLEAAIPAIADAAELIVARPDGTEVMRMPVDANAATHEVTPRAPDGTALAPGSYVFTVQPYSTNGQILPIPAARYAPVREVLVEDGATLLVLDGGVRMEAAKATGVRPPVEAAEG